MRKLNHLRPRIFYLRSSRSSSTTCSPVANRANPEKITRLKMPSGRPKNRPKHGARLPSRPVLRFRPCRNWSDKRPQVHRPCLPRRGHQPVAIEKIKSDCGQFGGNRKASAARPGRPFPGRCLKAGGYLIGCGAVTVVTPYGLRWRRRQTLYPSDLTSCSARIREIRSLDRNGFGVRPIFLSIQAQKS